MPSLARRRFLGTSVAAGAAGIAPLAAGAVATPPPLTHAWFAPHVGSEFVAHDASGRASVLVLDRIEPLAHAKGYPSAAQAAQWCFTARFEGTPGTLPQTGLVQLEHAVLGSMTLMLSPVDATGTTCEAVFNRIRLA